MPWDITIVNYAGSPPPSYHAPDRPAPEPLGPREDVIRAIREAVPELEWHESGGPPPHLLAGMPPEIRAIMSRRRVTAGLDGGGFHVTLYGFEQEPVGCLHAEVRGNGNPVPLLARLCAAGRWSVVSDTDGSFVDLTAAAAPQWNDFQAYCDRAISEVRDPSGKPS